MRAISPGKWSFFNIGGGCLSGGCFVRRQVHIPTGAGIHNTVANPAIAYLHQATVDNPFASCAQPNFETLEEV